MDKLVCKHCGNVVYNSGDNVMSDVEFHGDKPYDVAYIECPKCGKSIYLYNEFEESSETIEKQLEYLEIYPNSVWNWIKSEETAEPSRVESNDSKCQASEIRKYGIKLLDTLSEVIPKALLEGMYHNVNSYRSDEDIVQKVEEENESKD